MRKLYLLLQLSLFFCEPALAHLVPQPLPTLHYVAAGYGAAALGMGGAFVSVANDLSALYWNPAGLTQLPGLTFYLDYRHQGDSDEDFAASAASQGFNSKQSYSLSGNQIQAISVSYALRKPGFTIVPAFGFQRLSIFPSNRDLKEPAFNEVDSPQGGFRFVNTGLFQQEIKKGEDEFSFGAGASISKRLFIGGAWSFLRDGPEETTAGNFQNSVLSDVVSPDELYEFSITGRQVTTNKYSGNYLKIGVLAMPSPILNLGGTIRFPYTRKNTFTIHTTGPFTATDTFYDQDGNVDHVVTTQGNLNDTSANVLNLKRPFEWSGGASIRPALNYMISGSITYSNWSNVQIIPSDENVPSLLQWRLGFQYLIGEIGNGLALRTGFFRDGQPIRIAGDRSFFKGFTFGIGYASRSIHVDAAFVRETGDFTSVDSIGKSQISNRRLLISFGFNAE